MNDRWQTIFVSVYETIFVRNNNCQKWCLSETIFVRNDIWVYVRISYMSEYRLINTNGICQKRYLSETIIVRNDICQERFLSEMIFVSVYLQTCRRSIWKGYLWRRDCRWRLTATHCNTLQHTATHCNTLQHTATHCNTLQHAATHCSALQHTATHCNTLQRTARAQP